MTVTPNTRMQKGMMLHSETVNMHAYQHATPLKSFTLNMPNRPPQQRVLPAGPRSFPFMHPVANTKIEKEPVPEGTKKPRARRTFKQLKREVACTVEGCTRRYETASSLHTHMRIKHPELLADMPPKKDSAKSKRTTPSSPATRDRTPQSPYSRIRPGTAAPKLPTLNPLRSYSFDCGTTGRTEEVLQMGSGSALRSGLSMNSSTGGLTVGSMEAFDMTQFHGAMNTPSLDSFDMPNSPLAPYGSGPPLMPAHPHSALLSQRPTMSPLHPHPLGMMMSQQAMLQSPQPIPHLSLASRSHSFDMRPMLRQQTTYTEFSNTSTIHTPTSSITPTQSILSRSISLHDTGSPTTDVAEEDGTEIDLASFPGLFGHLEFDSLFTSDQDVEELATIAPADLELLGVSGGI